MTNTDQLDKYSEWFRSTDDPQTGFIDGNFFRNKQVEFSEINGLAIFEGDIVLGTAEEVRKARTSDTEMTSMSGVAHGVAITGDRYRWPRGVIPWEMASGFTDPQRVTDAIRHWEQNTALRFPQRTSQNASSYPNYIRFFMGDGCWSFVGMQGGRQDISLANGCNFGAAVHEIGHAVGLWHEQSREDRDRFIRIVWANIEAGMEHNFNQHISDGDDIGAYDYDSIMHYGRFAFSRNGQATIEPLRPGAQIGQRNGLSQGDIAAVRAMYPDVGAILPGSIATPQELRFRDANGMDIVIATGFAVFNFRGDSGSWLQRDIHILAGPRWRRIDDVAATVSLACGSNDNHAVNAGFAADNCRWTDQGGRVLLQSRLAIRDTDGYLHRVAYHAVIKGRL